MLLIDELTQSALMTALYGTKRVFEKQLKLRGVQYVFNNDHKFSLRKKTNPVYPYAYFAITNILINRDSANVKNLAREGISNNWNNFRGPVSGATKSTVNQYFMFPAELTCELHYISDDIRNIIKFIETSLLLAFTNTLNFRTTMNEEVAWITAISIDASSISVPEYDLESADSPGASEIVIPFTVKTRIGFVRDTARVNSDRPVLTFAMQPASAAAKSAALEYSDPETIPEPVLVTETVANTDQDDSNQSNSGQSSSTAIPSNIYVNKAGDVMTGPLLLYGYATSVEGAITLGQLENYVIDGGTF